MAAVVDLTCDQGATFVKHFAYLDAAGQPINLTGFTASMQVRHRYADADFEAEPLVSLTSNAGIQLGGATGTIAVTIEASLSEAIPRGEHRYDLELVNGTTVTRLLQGTFTVDPEVTR